MLVQIHHEFHGGKIEICAQREIKNSGEMQDFVDDVKKSHPLPVGAQYLACTEESPHFVKTEAG